MTEGRIVTRPSLAGIEQRAERSPMSTWTDITALTAAVRDVLKVAAPHWEWVTRRETKFGRPAPDASCVCEVCKIVRALAAHLDLTDPEGDPT